ncbi:Serine/threonine protein kinase [Agromyces sp. CF514]|uniref:serine/threonine-protein kinase n=1 Tax=Agromyces sp. CF514 TaxID=1881031 RepID=UPI0008E2DCEC|nr:serine/threonine-protein kinase [Agromyces sp. CF514]SFR75234.1 Serine/threonine protein kinase [Agromyces sp. CF514]
MRRATSTPPELPGYTAQGLLGSGGFADVFLYEQRLPRRKVAVKVLLTEELGRDTRAQFVAEANLMAQLSAHPYIVTIFHADVSADGRPYFVMEYCSGPSLAEQYKRSPFAVEDALRTGVRISGAVATAHAAGILHRDIKPANVLTNDYGWPALTDFGISSNLDGELPTHTVTVRPGDQATGTAGSGGTAAVGMSVPWSPAEMFEDDPSPDPRSDVFSLAATVYTLLAGRSPFEIPGRSNGTLDLIGRIERGAITPMDRTDLPRSLLSVLAKGMATSRDDRYQSAVEFARALQRVELELGYAATTIEVPNLAVAEQRESEPDSADATRARAVRTIDAQAAPAAPAASARAVVAPPASPAPVAGSADATVARSPQRVVAQPPLSDATVMRPGGPAAMPVLSPAPVGSASAPIDDGTIVRPGGAVREAGGASGSDAAHAASAGSTGTAPSRRSRTGLVVGIVAGAVVAIAVAAAVVLSGTLPKPEAEAPVKSAGQDAVAEATVPVPEVAIGVPAADGTSVSFEVAIDEPEEGDRWRWRRSDGSGTVQVADASPIVVDGVAAGQKTCIDVQTQRGSRTSEPVTSCTP